LEIFRDKTHTAKSSPGHIVDSSRNNLWANDTIWYRSLIPPNAYW